MTLTPTVLTDVRIYYATADLTGFANKVDLASMVEDLDRTTFASAGSKERVGGLFDSTASLSGFWDVGDLTKPDDTFWADLGLSEPLTIVPASGTVGSLAYLTKTLECDWKPGGTVGKLLEWSASLKGNWPVARGAILHPQGTARTTTGSGTGVQLGAVLSTQRLYACLHVLSISGTGTPTLTVKVQSSPDNTWAAPVDRITFNASTALDAQTGSVLGAITDTWWRATWTISGTTPSFLFAVSAGIASK